MRKHKILVAAMIFMAVFFTSSLLAEGQSDNDTMKFAVFIANNTNEFTMSVGNGAVKRGEELGYEVTVFDGDYDQGKQINQIETCIVQGYDGLIIEPCTPDGLDPVIKQATEAGIPIVTVIQQISNQNLVGAFVGADTSAAARKQMEACVEAIGGKGKIAVLEGAAGSFDHIIISKAFDEVVSQYPGVEIVERQDAQWVIDKAITITETWLQKYDDFSAILGENGDTALGAIKACQDAGIKTGVNGIYVSGRDAVSDELSMIKSGLENATIWQNGPNMGATALDTVIKMINGEPIEKKYIMENVIVSQDNVDEYIQLKKDLGLM